MSEISISTQLNRKITAAFKAAKNPVKYWNREEILDIASISKVYDAKLEGKDYFSDLIEDRDLVEIEIEHIAKVIRPFLDDIKHENDLENTEPDDQYVYEIAEMLLEHYRDLFQPDMNMKKICPKVNVRLRLHSNYDCINSHWLEGSSGYDAEESYFGDVLKMISINPKEMKEFMQMKGEKTRGKWPNLGMRKPYVRLGKFWTEIENRSCGGNLLTIIGQVNSYDLLTKQDLIIEVPAGNKIGFYSDGQGGGSVLECELIRPMKIDTTKSLDDGYLKWELVLDDDSGYSVKDCFGVNDSFFEGNITLKQKHKHKCTISKD